MITPNPGYGMAVTPTKYIVPVHESGTFSFVFVIRHRCCWIASHYLWKSRSWLGVQVWWYMEMRPRDWECRNCWKPTMWQKGLPLLQLEPGVFECQHFLRERLVPIFTGHVLETIGQSRIFYFLFFSFVVTHILFDVIGAEPKLMFHIVGGTEFLLQPFVSWAGVSCLPLPSFALHKALVLACIAQHLLAEFGDNLAMCH